LSLWGKGGKGIRTFSVEEGEEEDSFSGEGSTELEDCFFLGSTFLEGNLGGQGLSKSLGTPSVASPSLLNELVSRGEEGEQKEF